MLSSREKGIPLRGDNPESAHDLTDVLPAARIRLTMRFKKLFTRREAESSLPLVRRIVADALETARKIRALDEGDPAVSRLQTELEEHMRELEEMGCYFKDWNFSVGLVDFPAVIDGETVFLCWRSDESTLDWYHSVEEGYGGRKRLPDPATSS
jgi:hypothetical protein